MNNVELLDDIELMYDYYRYFVPGPKPKRISYNICYEGYGSEENWLAETCPYTLISNISTYEEALKELRNIKNKGYRAFYEQTKMNTNEIKVYIKAIIHSCGNIFEKKYQFIWFKKSEFEKEV